MRMIRLIVVSIFLFGGGEGGNRLNMTRVRVSNTLTLLS